MGHADEAPGTAPTAAGLRGGTQRGADGFFRVAQDEIGQWWLLDPSGSRFFLRSVHGVESTKAHSDGALPQDNAARLRGWGFNAAGVSQDFTLRDDGLPFLASVEFCRARPPLTAPGLRLPDVFDPEWPRIAAQRAKEVCPALVETR